MIIANQHIIFPFQLLAQVALLRELVDALVKPPDPDSPSSTSLVQFAPSPVIETGCWE